MPPRKQKNSPNAHISSQKSEINNNRAMNSRSNENPNSSSDEEDSNIFKGFSVQKNVKPIVLIPHFLVKPSVTIDDFYNILLPACDDILQIRHDETENQNKFSHVHRRMAQAISKTSQITAAYESLCQRLQKFCNDLPQEMSFYFSEAESIGIFWNSIEDKINKIMILFDSLSYKSKSIPEVFAQYCSEAFKSNIEIFKQASQLIIQSYDNYREKKQNPPIDSSIQFLKETGLFNDYFIPLFIDSVINHIEPKINHSFESSPFSEYLETATEISEGELELATVFDNHTLSYQLNDRINKLIFSSKKEKIYDMCLRPLLRGQEIDSIWTCSKLARSTNAFNLFISKMALLFEEEATDCFTAKKNGNDNNEDQEGSFDPISKLLKLYRSLNLFCSRACGPQSTKTVRAAFKRGFNTQPELVARLLALSIHHLFTKEKNENNTNDTFDYELIEQYVGLFRMLFLKDVFDTYHTQLLTRRILTMKDKMVEPECFFIDKLKQQCGADYTDRMEELLKNRMLSQDLSSKFIKENLDSIDENDAKQKSKHSTKNNDDNERYDIVPKNYFSCFRCLILPSQTAKTWDSLGRVQMSPPWPISLLLSKFSDFYEANMIKRKIEWSLQLSTVKLGVTNIPGLKKVKCSGDFATILLAFNKESQSNQLKRMKQHLKEIEKEEEKRAKEVDENKSFKKTSKKAENKNKKQQPKTKNKKKTRSRSSKDYSNSSDNDDTASSEADIEEEEEEAENKNVSKKSEKSEVESEVGNQNKKNEDNIKMEIAKVEEALKEPWKNYLTLEQLSRIVDSNDDDIISRIRILKSKKSSKIIIEEKTENNMKSIYKINKKCEAPKGSLTLQFIFPQLSVKEEEKSNRDDQLDAAIMRVLKTKKSMEKDFLYNTILNLVKYKITRDYFEERLKDLEHKSFLLIDPAGKAHYLD